MLALPPVAPVVGWRSTTRLPRDHYVRVDSNDYSVHPAVVGRRVEIAADLDEVTGDLRGRPRWPATRGAGPAIRPSPTPPMPPPRPGCGTPAALAAVPAVDTDVEHRSPD